MESLKIKGNDGQMQPVGLILEEVGTGWRHLGGDKWESPCGEIYVGINLVGAESVELSPTDSKSGVQAATPRPDNKAASIRKFPATGG